MSPADHGERGPSGLPRPLAWVRWVAWAMTNRAFTRHHLLSYLRMARARARYPSLRFEGPCFIGPDVRFEVREGYGRLVHEEHGPIALAAGVYRVVRQREYFPGAIRPVAD